MLMTIVKGDSKSAWLFDTECTVQERAECEFEGPFYQRVDLEIYDEKHVKLLAEVSVYCFDMNSVDWNVDALVDIADSIDQEVYDAIATTVEAGLLPEDMSDKPILCYLQTLHVKPEFRMQGIGSWLIKNLKDLLYFYYEKEIYGFVTYPRPSDNHTDDEEIEEIANTDEMYQLMVNLITGNGFLNIKDTNYFFKNYEVIYV